jgi:hypothetical protein
MNVDLHDDGILWLINKSIFHGRGFALGHVPGTSDFVLLGDGTETWRYATPEEQAGREDLLSEDEKFKAVEAMFARARQENV